VRTEMPAGGQLREQRPSVAQKSGQSDDSVVARMSGPAFLDLALDDLGDETRLMHPTLTLKLSCEKKLFGA
jgi:hypothetical protein